MSEGFEMIANYHTHTRRCHHAVGRDETYVKEAIKKGIKVLGFADHGPFPYEGFKSHMRMTVSEAQSYFKSLRNLREKYKDVIDIKIGFEYEYFPEYTEWLKGFLKENEVDYIILGHHYSPSEQGGTHTEALTKPEELLLYRDMVCEAIRSGMYLYVAHPDLYMGKYQKFDETARQVAEDICKTASECNVPLEFNLYGLRKSADAGYMKYPYTDFWLVAKKYGCRVIQGIDAHNPKHIKQNRYFKEAEEKLRELGITPEGILEI